MVFTREEYIHIYSSLVTFFDFNEDEVLAASIREIFAFQWETPLLVIRKSSNHFASRMRGFPQLQSHESILIY